MYAQAWNTLSLHESETCSWLFSCVLSDCTPGFVRPSIHRYFRWFYFTFFIFLFFDLTAAHDLRSFRVDCQIIPWPNKRPTDTTGYRGALAHLKIYCFCLNVDQRQSPPIFLQLWQHVTVKCSGKKCLGSLPFYEHIALRLSWLQHCLKQKSSSIFSCKRATV